MPMDKRQFGKKWSAQRVAATRKRNAEKREVAERLKRIHETHFSGDVTREAEITAIIKGAIL